MGTPELSRASLQALLAASDLQVVAVVTQPDRPKGRDLKLAPSPVKTLAESRNLPLFQPERARDEGFIGELAALRPDLIAVAAYGQILPRAILDLPVHGCLNVHTSLLPKYRGAAPIQWAILNGDPVTGVTIMRMDPGMDTGDIVTREETAITPQDTAATLHDQLAEIGARLLVDTIPGYVSGRIKPVPQAAGLATHAPKIKKEDGRLDWSQPATALWNRVRGLVPWPGAFSFMPGPGAQPALLKIWAAEVTPGRSSAGEILEAGKDRLVVACGADALALTLLQKEGGRRMPARDFLAGHPLLKPGARLR